MRNLVILAGGKSSRMGRDKVLLKIDGKAFIEHLYEKAAASFDRIIISTDTGEHAQTIKSLPAFVTAAGSFRAPEFVTDIYAEKGPMGGIVSVFEATDADKFAIISVDVPHADMQVLAYLFDHCEKSACFLRFEGRKENLLLRRTAGEPTRRSRRRLRQAGISFVWRLNRRKWMFSMPQSLQPR